jgi:hypothetical protein
MVGNKRKAAHAATRRTQGLTFGLPCCSHREKCIIADSRLGGVAASTSARNLPFQNMRTPILFALLGILALIVALSLGASPRQISEDEKIWDYLGRHRPEMIRITQKPYRVNWAGAPLCIRPNSIPHSPHGEHWIHVFVSPSGTNTMLTGTGTYPVGTFILKQKFLDAVGTNTEFYTGMRKRERDYNPELGDWEFFTMNRSGSMVTARGKIESCMDCHTKYKSTDFVSRRYLTVKEDTRR